MPRPCKNRFICFHHILKFQSWIHLGMHVEIFWDTDGRTRFWVCETLGRKAISILNALRDISSCCGNASTNIPSLWIDGDGAVTPAPRGLGLMFRTKRAIISPIWTHSCQRSNDLRLLSPIAQLRWFKENGSHQANEPVIAIWGATNALW